VKKKKIFVISSGLILLLLGVAASLFGFGIQEWGVGETGNHELQFQAGGIAVAVVGLVLGLLSIGKVFPSSHK